jgi:hypothetical protein
VGIQLISKKTSAVYKTSQAAAGVRVEPSRATLYLPIVAADRAREELSAHAPRQSRHTLHLAADLTTDLPGSLVVNGPLRVGVGALAALQPDYGRIAMSIRTSCETWYALSCR